MANSSKYPIVYRQITLWVAKVREYCITRSATTTTPTPSQPAESTRATPRQQGANQPSRQQVVGCPHCRRHLMPPPGAPRFRCPCGRILKSRSGIISCCSKRLSQNRSNKGQHWSDVPGALFFCELLLAHLNLDALAAFFWRCKAMDGETHPGE